MAPGVATRVDGGGATPDGLLPLGDAISHLVPTGSLRTGSLVRVSGGAGATSLAMALVAGPCRAGARIGCVGFAELGWEAAENMGLPLDRVVVVEMPGDAGGDLPVKVMAALVDAFEIVVLGPEVAVTPSIARRLKARARERRSLLLRVDVHVPGLHRSRPSRAWPDEDVVLEVTESAWEGLGRGWGHLSRRRVIVQVTGRGSSSCGRRHRVDFGPSGAATCEPVRGGRGVGEVVALGTGTG